MTTLVTLPTAWVRIGRVSFRRRMLLSAGGTSVVLVLYPALVLGPQLSAVLAPPLPGWIAACIGAAGGALLTAGVLAVVAALASGLHLSVDGTSVRIRRWTGPAASIDRASLLAERPFGPRRNLVLELRAGHRITRVWLRSRDRVLLEQDEREALAAALERSTIAPPSSSHDPDGRFARVNFPGSLTRDEAVALVRRVPLMGEPVPITD